jgi:hypothetical protein
MPSLVTFPGEFLFLAHLTSCTVDKHHPNQTSQYFLLLLLLLFLLLPIPLILRLLVYFQARSEQRIKAEWCTSDCAALCNTHVFRGVPSLVGIDDPTAPGTRHMHP